MPKFLNREELYRLLQRELPADVYPDGAPSGFFSTADNDGVAKTLESAYTNLSRIYDNYFIATADEKMSDWETALFGRVSDAGVDLTTRRARALQKFQKRQSLAEWELLTMIASYLPEGVYVQIVRWGVGSGGSWILGKSAFGVDTSLGWGDPSTVDLSDPATIKETLASDGWRLGRSHLGTETKLSGKYSYQTLSRAQAKAYTYEVRIFGYMVTDTDYARLIDDLSHAEAARDGRVVKQNQNLTDYGLIYSVTGVDQFSGINCIARDSTSTTGYSGKKVANGD